MASPHVQTTSPSERLADALRVVDAVVGSGIAADAATLWRFPPHPIIVIIGAINPRDAATVTGNSAAPVFGEGQEPDADAKLLVPPAKILNPKDGKQIKMQLTKLGICNRRPAGPLARALAFLHRDTGDAAPLASPATAWGDTGGLRTG